MNRCESCGARAGADEPLRHEELCDGRQVTVEMYECANCAERWDLGELADVRDLTERLAPGDEVPMGECPSCGCFCYPTEGVPA